MWILRTGKIPSFSKIRHVNIALISLNLKFFLQIFFYPKVLKQNCNKQWTVKTDYTADIPLQVKPIKTTEEY